MAESRADGSRAEELAKSTDMAPVAGTVEVAIPVDVLWRAFVHGDWWPRWNACFFWVKNRDLVRGERLVWCFQPIRPWYLYKMPAVATIVEREERKKVTWEVTALPGFYARHTYHMEDLGGGRSRFGSWEQATGWSFRLMRRFWIAHFTFVKDRSLEGARRLERVYADAGRIDETTVTPPRPRGRGVAALLLLVALVGGTLGIGAGVEGARRAAAVVAALGLVFLLAGAAWFYRAYVQLTAVPLAPGVHAVLGGGGNSLVVEGEGEALLVDSKFGWGGRRLHAWIVKNVRAPVTTVVNTHYHYDHTQGNTRYAGATMVAHRAVPELMRVNDGDWWTIHGSGVPRPENTVPDEGAVLRVGRDEVILHHAARGHTRGDLYVHVPRANIVATGDLVFHTYYPFMDQPEGGTSIPGMVAAVRQLARDHPDAVFLPGHGPLARATDLLRYADYLEGLYRAVGEGHRHGWSEDETAQRIGGGQGRRRILPSLHHGRLIWATARSSARWAFRLWSDQAPVEREHAGASARG